MQFLRSTLFLLPMAAPAGLGALPRSRGETRNDGIAVNCQDVWLHETLQESGGPTGTESYGKALASYLIAKVQDGSQVVCSLSELDPLFTRNQILLADAADDKLLTEAQGPCRLVAPEEKRGDRSVRMLTRLEVVLLRNQK